MTGKEILRTRCILAKSIRVSPDDHVHSCKDAPGFFSVEYKDYNLVVGFDKVPSVNEAREEIKNLYLSGVELDFDGC